MGLTRQLVALVRRKTVTPDDLAAASLFVADTLACAVGARGTKPARAIGAVSPWDGPDPRRRAFHFGGLAHILELDDLHRRSVTHPGTVVIPAAAGLASEIDPGGVAFLTAILHGYEVCCRIGNAVGEGHYRVWHNTATCGAFGAAMASACLLGLDEDEAVWALGSAGTQAGGLWEFLAAGAMSKHLHTARTAESGLLAALLAREGFTGAETILEGEKGFFAVLCPDPRPDSVLEAPEAPWELTRTSIKPWPCCRHTHPAIDAAITLHGRLSGRTITRVEIGAYRAAIDVCDRAQPDDAYGAKFSLQHCVAEALSTGAVGLASFDNVRRDALAELRGRTGLVLDEAVQALYPDAWGARVSVTASDGEMLVETRDACKGDPDAPLSAAELSRKAADLLQQGGMTPGEADEILGRVQALATGAPVGDLFDLCFSPTAPRFSRSPEHSS